MDCAYYSRGWCLSNCDTSSTSWNDTNIHITYEYHDSNLMCYWLTVLLSNSPSSLNPVAVSVMVVAVLSFPLQTPQMSSRASELSTLSQPNGWTDKINLLLNWLSYYHVIWWEYCWTNIQCFTYNAASLYTYCWGTLITDTLSTI